jgi:hypothetical protein
MLDFHPPKKYQTKNRQAMAGHSMPVRTYAARARQL